MRKENRTYFFSVEGDTEQWYLEWLQRAINAAPEAACTVKLDCKIQKDPFARVKRMKIVRKTEITHLFDYESGEEEYEREFKTVIDRMREAESSGKDIQYRIGYSNFTFELWMILHMADCNGPLTHRRQYLPLLNKAYGENFGSLEEYKHENNFKRILGKLTLANVRQAVQRSRTIMQVNQESGRILQQYKGYPYYKENPSLTVWEQIEKILKVCKLS